MMTERKGKRRNDSRKTLRVGKRASVQIVSDPNKKKVNAKRIATGEKRAGHLLTGI